jgi:type IV secretion system protein VirB1
MAAIVAVESGWRPYAIDDDDAHRSYYPGTRAEAIAIARSLERAGHNFDVGLAQVNSANFAAYGLSTEAAFDPCANLRAGSRILVDAFRQAQSWLGGTPAANEQRILLHALSIYNSGSPVQALEYARRVVSAARDAGRMQNPVTARGAKRVVRGFTTAPEPAATVASTFRTAPISLERTARDAGL